MKSIRIGNAAVVLVALGCGGLVFGSVLMSVGDGAGKRFILDRIFKYHVRAHKRDVAGGRLDLWMAAVRDWASSPLIGTGLGQRIVVGGGSQGKVRAVPLHNLYIQTLAQTGLVGFSIVSIAVLTWYVRAHRAIQIEPDERQFWPRFGMFTYVVTLLFGSIYNGVMPVSCLAFLFWICVGLETGAHSQQDHRTLAKGA
jgi:O-antigen ligase